MASRFTGARGWVLVFALAAGVYLPGIDRPLRDSEAKYAQVPAEMLARGDWLTPYLDGARYYVKPPLTYWTTAVLYAALGVSEGAARLSTVLWAFLSALVTGLLARRMFDARTGLLATTLFLLTVMVYVYCLDAGIQFGLVACVILSMLGFQAFRDSRSLGHLCLFHAAAGLGFLAKGLPGVLTPLGVATIFLAWRRDGETLRRLFHPAGLAVLALLCAPWPLVMAARHPEFLHVFFVDQHLLRFAGAMMSNDALHPTGLWLLLVAGEFFPWAVHLPGAALDLRRMLRAGTVDAERVGFLAIWAALPLAVYAASRSKVDAYGLEIYPPLVILLAVPLADLLAGARHASPRAWAVPWVAVSAGAVGFLVLGGDRLLAETLAVPSVGVVQAFLVVAAGLGLAAAVGFARGRPGWALAAVACLSIALFQSARFAYARLYPEESRRFAAEIFNARAGDGDVLVSDEPPEFEHVAGLAFYTGRRVLLLRDREASVLHFREADRAALCLDDAALSALVRLPGDVYLVGETGPTERRAEELALSYETLATSGGRSLLRVDGR